MQPEIERLKEMMRTHDRHYAMSDDYSVYRRGHQEWEAIRSLANRLGDEGQALLSEYISQKMR